MAAAILPLEEIPARFHARLLYEEDFVIAVRLGTRSPQTRRSPATLGWSTWLCR